MGGVEKGLLSLNLYYLSFENIYYYFLFQNYTLYDEVHIKDNHASDLLHFGNAFEASFVVILISVFEGVHSSENESNNGSGEGSNSDGKRKSNELETTLPRN